MTAAYAAVRERPLLFSAPMVRAILDGTKTQTRRTRNLDTVNGCHLMAGPRRADGSFVEDEQFGDVVWSFGTRTIPGDPQNFYVDHRIGCPFGVPGDRLWVRETVAIESWTREYGDYPPLPKDRPSRHVSHPDGDIWYWPHYRATDPVPDLSCERDRCRVCESGEPGPHWRPSIHMPRWACRIVLEITEVRVERLQAISADDAIAEGSEVPRSPDGFPLLRLTGKNPPTRYVDIAGAAFPDKVVRAYYASLWDDINGTGSWDANPWVWALTFKRPAP